jgi:hypothetical protein
MGLPASKNLVKQVKSVVAFAARTAFPLWLMAGLLGPGVLIVYWPAMRCDFVNFDEDLYVTANAHVQHGLTWGDIKWALLNPVASNWHPLTMMSHMLDCELFGMNPFGHHLINVLLHAVNIVLVYLLLLQLTGAKWRSWFVAVLFACHPLHVESVTWISERKDVLSGSFGLLSLIFYARYARDRVSRESSQPPASAMLIAGSREKTNDYGLALLFLTLGLMSKAMLVTWPFVMLLIDYWPLSRVHPGKLRGLVLEKIPFFVVAAVTSIVTLAVQQHTGAVAGLANVPIEARIENSVISYCRYLGMLFCPINLAIFYPLPESWPIGYVLSSVLFLAGTSVLFWQWHTKHPFLLMGWLWFLGTLVPVIGLVQAGDQSVADRYMYLPSLGLFILIVWGGNELTRRWRHRVTAISLAATGAIIACIYLTNQQLGYWQDSEILFEHALAVTKDNYIAQNNLGAFLLDHGHFDEAIGHLQEAIRLKPRDADAIYNLANVYYTENQFDEAINHYPAALRLEPDAASVHLNLGNAYVKKGQFEEAITQ